MCMVLKCLFLIVVLQVILSVKVYGQEVDGDSLATDSQSIEGSTVSWRQAILPASLFGAGAVAVGVEFLRNSSREMTHSVIGLRGERNRFVADDYIQYVPVVSALMMGSLGLRAKHPFRERALIVATSYATLAVLTNVPKLCVDEKRPEFTGRNSFPSGHTATAFMGAELVRLEYGGWYGMGAYLVAAGVGFMRMYNGRHWFHDVVGGAGVGMLSAWAGEWSCQWWARVFHKRERNVALIPVAAPVDGGYYGVAMSLNF